MAQTDIIELVKELAQRAVARQRVLATAESCTGGLISAAFTEVAGSSGWFDRGFVTYSNSAKSEMLGVPEQTLQTHGAVSEATVIAMAEGAVAHSDASLAVSVSGVAGPDGGSAEKPVGTVWIGCAGKSVQSFAEAHLFNGDRASVRHQTVIEAARLLIRCI